MRIYNQNVGIGFGIEKMGNPYNEKRNSGRKISAKSELFKKRNDSQKLAKGIGRIGNQIKNRDYSHYRVAEISQITEKSPGDLRGLNVT